MITTTTTTSFEPPAMIPALPEWWRPFMATMVIGLAVGVYLWGGGGGGGEPSRFGDVATITQKTGKPHPAVAFAFCARLGRQGLAAWLRERRTLLDEENVLNTHYLVWRHRRCLLLPDHALDGVERRGHLLGGAVERVNRGHIAGLAPAVRVGIVTNDATLWLRVIVADPPSNTLVERLVSYDDLLDAVMAYHEELEANRPDGVVLQRPPCLCAAHLGFLDSGLAFMHRASNWRILAVTRLNGDAGQTQAVRVPLYKAFLPFPADVDEALWPTNRTVHVPAHTKLEAIDLAPLTQAATIQVYDQSVRYEWNTTYESYLLDTGMRVMFGTMVTLMETRDRAGVSEWLTAQESACLYHCQALERQILARAIETGTAAAATTPTTPQHHQLEDARRKMEEEIQQARLQYRAAKAKLGQEEEEDTNDASDT